jgi:hypothetical protein
MPSARAASSIVNSESVLPQSGTIASFTWLTCTGSFASRPIAMISSIASQKVRSSLRIWLV